MDTPPTAPAPGVFRPPPPVPGSLDAARQAGRKIGVAYGEFDSAVEEFMSRVNYHGAWGAYRSEWEKEKPERKLKVLLEMQHEYDALPKLPPTTSLAMAKALREGFREGAKNGYEAARFEALVVWVFCEFAKDYALARAAVPSVHHIGAAASSARDCTAHTASRAILEMTGVEVSPEKLVARFGIPTESVDTGYRVAVAYARSWFERLGFRLSDLLDFEQAIRRRAVGRYAVFFQGKGHVVFGEITATEVRLIDDQSKVVYRSVIEAQNGTGYQIGGAYKIESVAIPQ
ncbi:hypothetical protein ACQPW1_28540 [Nocardia sp. CA-128927]|uniref:hypothetical protein n=1 Tax=Nocardia sp. CA-128927 TaxID=3239975 RepID=UPI003D99343B